MHNEGIISEVEIKNNLKTKILGNKIKIFETINSTNTYLKENECSNGEVVIALQQTAGKGRRNKAFISNENQGIYFSFILKANTSIEQMSSTTICVAVAVTRALKKVCKFDADVKWVNDIFYMNKKLGGILTEVVLTEQNKDVEKLIIGIGLNTGEIPSELTDIAISLKEVVSSSNYKNELISEILNCFEEIYFDKFNNEFAEILNEYKERLFFLNKEIEVIGKENYNAIALGLTTNGELIVSDEDNNIRILNSGEISVKIV